MKSLICQTFDRRDEISERKSESMPALVEEGGSAAKFAYEEFFYGQLRNPSTRKNYRHAVARFLKFYEPRQRPLTGVMPRDIGEYLDQMPSSPATKKLHLAALRHFFDAMVNRHAMLLNPAASVRGPRLQVIEGKTPEIGVAQARKLLRSIDATDIVGLRDRAIIAILIYTAVRVNAVASLRLQDFYDAGNQHCLRFEEKNGKSREIPCRHDLQTFLSKYISEANSAEPKAPLFRTVLRRTKHLTSNPMKSGDIARMVKRRCRRIHLPARFSPHSFRVTTITDLLDQGVPLADVQQLAGHADPRTTRLYDRRQRQVTRNIVERISV
jgi:site-specific recombinase XerD